jgi:hypothetical protein
VRAERTLRAHEHRRSVWNNPSRSTTLNGDKDGTTQLMSLPALVIAWLPQRQPVIIQV